MNKHTPGPWDFDSFALREEIRAENNPLIAIVCSVHCDSPEQTKANAHLIAAAPDLLFALEKVYTDMNDDMPVRLRKVCYEAIAKAKGE